MIDPSPSFEPAEGARSDGVLPAQDIARLVESGCVGVAPGGQPVDPAQIQPASLDLRLGAKAYRVRASFLASAGATVAERLQDFAMHEVDLTDGAVFETGCVYVAPLQERVRLPENMSAAANAKSSIGRVDVFTRLITDYGTEFDRIEAGYDGPLYVEIAPRTFSVLARTGARLSQIRFRVGAPAFSAEELARLQADQALVAVSGGLDLEGGPGDAPGLPFSVDLRSTDGGPVGYRARRFCGLIDLDRIAHYDPADFWDPIFPQRFAGAGGTASGVILDPGAFYILVSQEQVHVPPHCAAEMTPYLAVVGEFRVHYAGFFDPGFGHAAAGGAGSRGVLEVRCHEQPFALEHGQVVGRLIYEPMLSPPDRLYGDALGSNYQAQGLRLSKHFKR
ncbi:MAG: 2'-deoxycytidine 5'-triphosphate deaminase [Pseudomonadota bacterium]